MKQPVFSTNGYYVIVSQFEDLEYFSYSFARVPDQNGKFFADYYDTSVRAWVIIGNYNTEEEAKQAAVNAWVLGIGAPDTNLPHYGE